MAKCVALADQCTELSIRLAQSQACIQDMDQSMVALRGELHAVSFAKTAAETMLAASKNSIIANAVLAAAKGK